MKIQSRRGLRALLAAAVCSIVSVSAQAGSMSSPRGLAVDAQGNLYVANAGNNTVTVYNKQYQLTNTISANINLPTSVSVTQDTIYVTNYLNNNVTAYTLAGTPLPGATVVDGNLVEPRASVADSLGNLWVLDQSGTLHCYIGGTNPTPRPVGGAGAAGATALALAHEDLIRIAPTGYRSDPAGPAIAYVLANMGYYYGTGSFQGQMEYAASDSVGNIYLTDAINRQVLLYQGPNTPTLIHQTGIVPEGIAVDSVNHRLYVGDAAGNEIIVYSSIPPYNFVKIIN